jgi:hypothetical protein
MHVFVNPSPSDSPRCPAAHSSISCLVLHSRRISCQLLRHDVRIIEKNVILCGAHEHVFWEIVDIRIKRTQTRVLQSRLMLECRRDEYAPKLELEGLECRSSVDIPPLLQRYSEVGNRMPDNHGLKSSPQALALRSRQSQISAR